ncbi:MAG: GH32 C-terminal domain-containing protein [Muribaculaceae bacterium]|nr:GH32 C-terminal domain-containing protein [Muribaculaceae bacterium]
MDLLNKTTKKILLTFAVAVSSMTAIATEGVEVHHLGINNSHVRVTGDARYVLFPVQESIDDATVNVIVDGKLEKTFYLRLAKNKVDYMVPFDITPYRGHNIIFDVVSQHDRTTVREPKNEAGWSHIALSDTFNTVNREKYRPVYHHTPLYGWMNDPNGMFYKDGVWHLYYQWNPYGSKWQNMTWGHSTSKDLVNWEHHPVAIEPNGLGTVFSGSCAIDHNNTAGYGKDAIIAMYTSAGASQMQSLAHSNDDGETFEIYAANPVITLDSEARDPNFFFNETTGEWNLVLAHALEHEVLVFSSPDLKHWTQKSAFGKVGACEGVWECPDLFAIDFEGGKKWVLLVNLNPGGPFGGSGIQYFVGDFDGTTFTPDTDADGTIPTKWLDYGKDNYAVVSWSDAPSNRRTLIGWMSNWQYAADVPTKQFRSANTLPREVFLFAGKDGRVYAGTKPSPELDAITGKPIAKAMNFTVGNPARTFALPEKNDGVCRITMDIDARKAAEVRIVLTTTPEKEKDTPEKVIMTYDPEAQTFVFDRTESGLDNFSIDFPATTVAPTFSDGERLSLDIFIDTSSIEVFGNDGRFAMTNLVFPTQPYDTIEISAPKGYARIENLKISPITVNN